MTILLAPSGTTSPTRGLQWLIFVGSSVHVASTGWFFTLPEVRSHARSHQRRYVVVPAVLVIGTALLAAVVAPARFTWLLLVFFGWQFFHFQKQNLGMAALAGISLGAGSVSRLERRALMAAGVAGIAGILLHPQLLELTLHLHVPGAFGLAATTFVASVTVGMVLLLRRPAGKRPPGYAVVYLCSLLFFLPVFVFTNPYAAVAGLVVAHGAQYLVIMGLIAGAERHDRTRTISLALLLNIALVGGLALNLASHQHGAELVGRLVYGAYLGPGMAHFGGDAGLWRMRDESPRAMLPAPVPYLVSPG